MIFYKKNHAEFYFAMFHNSGNILAVHAEPVEQQYVLHRGIRLSHDKIKLVIDEF